MSSPALQEAIDRANRRVSAGRNREFVKRASDEQMFNKLLEAAKAVLVSHKSGTDTGPSLDELRSMVAIAEKRMK